MKISLRSRKEFKSAGRWDIDFHLPAEGIKKFPTDLLKRAGLVAEVVKDKRDPTKAPDSIFRYIDISSVDISTGTVTHAQEIEGSEAPSRARKVVSAFDIIVSTCRPTRGAIAIIPAKLHNQIASTGFCVLRAHNDINPIYLHFVLRLPSTLEQFRKWSTGSSYPAILDSDVEKTLVPIPSAEDQDAIAAKIIEASRARSGLVRSANSAWTKTLGEIMAALCGKDANGASDLTEYYDECAPFTIDEIRKTLSELEPIRSDKKGNAQPNIALFSK